MLSVLLIVASLLFAGGTAALLILEPFAPKHSAAARFEVTASEAGGRVRVDWNPEASTVAHADAGLLEIEDGEARQRYDIEKKVLQQGGLEYKRRSGDVLLTLSLLQGGKVVDRAAVRLLDSLGPKTPVERSPGPGGR